MDFYNESGEPIAYSDDAHIFLFDGRPAAYFHNDSIYTFSGNHLGWSTDGWIMDNEGLRVFFTDEATGGPFQPFKKLKPMKKFKKILPWKRAIKRSPFRPFIKNSWSELSSEDFFELDS